MDPQVETQSVLSPRTCTASLVDKNTSITLRIASIRTRFTKFGSQLLLTSKQERYLNKELIAETEASYAIKDKSFDKKTVKFLGKSCISLIILFTFQPMCYISSTRNVPSRLNPSLNTLTTDIQISKSRFRFT